MRKTLTAYFALLAFFGAAIVFVLYQGQNLPAPTSEGPARKAAVATASQGDWWAPFAHHINDPLGRLLLQVIVVIIATRCVGLIFVRFRQPAVVGEVLAGILLGPTLLGWAAPGVQSFIFPADSLGTLKLLSQIGVCLFMFVVGLELEIELLRQKARQAVLVSHVGMLFPMTLGVALALALYSGYAGRGSAFMPFALFMGVALSITAFPVLARILKERRMEKTFLGTTAIACAAVGDATAWILLAFVVALTGATSLAATAIGLGLVCGFVTFVLVGVRPMLERWLKADQMDESGPSSGTLVVVLLMLFICSLATEAIGVHALFGAFVAGVAMPSAKAFRDQLILRIENFASLFLLPLFFAFSGLRTQLNLLNDPMSWLVCLGIIGLATLGKLGGTMVTARLTGMGWRDSFSLGALMNTRGLVELVALNIGYDLGILSPRIFAMMVLMALVTTFMTGPLLNLAQRRKRSTVNDDSLASATSRG